MSDTTKIEWADSTFNPWTGCAKVSPGCDHCYAEGWAKRSGAVQWGPHAERRRTTAANWRKPLQWDERHAEFFAEYGRRRRVFCASLADVFDSAVPNEWRRDLFELIGRTQHLDWLLLTKRIGNARAMLNAVVEEMSHGLNTWDEGPWPGVWIGATVVNQQEAERDVPKLQDTQATVRFLSIEPMLGPITLGKGGTEKHGYLARTELGDWVDRGDDRPYRDRWTYADYPLEGKRSTKQGQYSVPRIDWVICGGESGPGARPMHPDWARSLRDQCAAAGTPFLFKQWGEWREPLAGEPYDTTMGRAQRVPAFIVAKSGTAHCFENDETRNGGKVMIRVGKKAAGRLLDGREHNGFPGAAC